MKVAVGLRHITRDSVTVPLIATAMLLALLAQGVVMRRSYLDTWALAVTSADNILKSITSNVERNLSIIDLSLSGVQDAVSDKRVLGLPPDLRNNVLFDRAAGAQFMGSMLVLNAHGDVMFDSDSVRARTVNFSDRDYFGIQKNGNVGTYLSNPYKSRLRDGDPSVALSRRLPDEAGEFAGIAMAAVRIAFFNQLLNQISLPNNSVITLAKQNGILISRSPSRNEYDVTGLDISKSPIFRRIVDNNEQEIVDYSLIDKVKRLYIHKKVNGFPLVLTVGLSTKDVMHDWWLQAIFTSLITILVCGLIMLTVRALRVSLRRSEAMEAELATLSLTDALTGLPNRRAFDLAFASEASRAERNQTPLSLAIIDADYFKKINDLYGHKVGDEVLRKLGAEIQKSIRRPGDFAARLGGEEFVVILPATGEAGALNIAEKIRGNISRMIPDLRAPALTNITVSIGVTSVERGAPSHLREMFERADRALYEAKGAGRNRIVFERQ